MRKQHLLFFAFATITYLSLSSYSSGPAAGTLGDHTGGTTPGMTCAHCHGGGAGTTTGTIELRKKTWGAASTPVTFYEAGETYLVKMTGTNASLPKFGFQFTALNSMKQPVGSYSALPAQTQGVPASSPTIVEHLSPLSKNGSGSFEVSFEWKAPTTSAGQITLYGIFNAVDGMNNDAGDKPGSTMSVVLKDATSVATVTNKVVFRAYPNPVSKYLVLDMDKAQWGTYHVAAYNASGVMVAQKDMKINANSNTDRLDAADWAAGIYFVKIQKDGDVQVLPVMKQ